MIRLYEIDDDYVDFLRIYDKRVLSTKMGTGNKHENI